MQDPAQDPAHESVSDFAGLLNPMTRVQHIADLLRAAAVARREAAEEESVRVGHDPTEPTSPRDFADLARDIATAPARRQTAKEERIRLEQEAADRTSNLRTMLLMELSDEQLDGIAPLSAPVAEAWQRVFPERPIINGHLATANQMQRLQEREEREGLVEWLVREHGRSYADARQQVDADYGRLRDGLGDV